MRQSPATPQAPTPPAPAVPAAPGVPGAVAQSPAGRPLTAEDVASLRARRKELSNQLLSADDRRSELVAAMEGTEGAARDGLEQRIRVLDERIVQLESDIASTGRELTDAPTGLVASTEVPSMFGGLSAGHVTGISIVFVIFVLAPLAIAVARFLWKRAGRPPAPPALANAALRLDQLQQSVDTIAVEIERVSESQRFMTSVLTEGQSPRSLGAGQPAAEPIRVPQGEAVGVPRTGD